MGTRMDPRQIRPPEGCLDTYGHRKGTRAQMGKGMVYGHISAPECCPGIAIWAPEWCLGLYWHRNGGRANMGTRMVPRHIWEPKWCPGPHWHWNGARAIMGTGMMPGLI